jgi:FAD/FMN-containing dehydrogenase
MMYATTKQAGFAYLREHLEGSVATPGDDRYDEARQAWNVMVDQRPAAVVRPESARDIATVVRFARAAGYRLAPQSTGHNAGPLGDLGETILVKTDRMRKVEIDPVARRARVQSGAIWEDVVEPAARHGLSVLHGSSPDVGVAGYALTGGVGWQVRLRGLATNTIKAVELVTADGELVRADAKTEPELFWAIRGGGGNFGIVTSIELELFPLETVYAGWLIFPWERSAEVLHRWAEWVGTVPDEMTSVGRILQLPPLPFIPEPIRGRNIVVVEAAYVGTEGSGATRLEPLRELGPEIDTVATVPAAALARLHQDPEGPTPALVEHALLDRLPADGLDAFLEVAGPGSGSQLISVEIRHLGGAAGVPAEGGGVASHVPAEFLTAAITMPTDADVAAAAEQQFAKFAAAMAPYGSGRQYLNFAERETDVSAGFPAGSYERLQALRARLDPQGVFKAAHEIEAA